MVKKLLPTALAGLMALALTATPSAGSTLAAPGGAAETSPIGTLRWLPVVANERPTGGGIFRLVVVYDNSLDPTTGEPTELLADGPWGMKLFSNSLVDTAGNAPTIRLRGHSPHTSSLDDVGAPTELDEAFIGLAGDVADGDCARLEDGDPTDLSFAYSTTFTLEGEPEELTACQVIDEQELDPDTDEVISTTITEYVPGFWFDVMWPYETDPAGAGGQGHTFSEVWYGAVPGFNDSDPAAFAGAVNTGVSPTLRGPGDYLHREILEDPEPNPSVPFAACPGTGVTIEYTVPEVPEKAKGLKVDLYPMGDWDLTVDDSGSGNAVVNESIVVPKPTEGQVVTIEGCNFAGGPQAELVLGWV